MKRGAPYLIFPIVLGGCVGAAIVLLEHGTSIFVAALVSLAPAALIIVLAERWLPFSSEWRRSRGDVGTDFMHSFVSNVAWAELVKALMLFALVPVSVWIADRTGIALWPEAWPLGVQLVLAAVIYEFGAYWAHRIAHEHGDSTFWRWHSIHHSPTRLYWFNAGRDHPLGVVLLSVPALVPLILLGATEEVLGALLVFTAIHGLFQHANIDVRLGPLNWVFSMAELHRWHHAKDIALANHNYGANLIVWDIVFRTRWLPAERPTEDVGIWYLPNFPEGYLNQLRVPFPNQWRELKAEGRRQLAGVNT